MVLILYIILVGVFASGFYLATITKNNKMENKINIAELLKDCPKGMELDCTMYEDVCFDYVDELNIIHCYMQHETHKTSITFNQHGTPNSDIKSKCVIFPKGKTTWKGFQRPFKDGDIVVTKTFNNFIFYAIYKGVENREVLTYVDYTPDDNRLINVNHTLCYSCEIIEQRLATEEEKQKLFDAIKANGYKWNTETKTLEKLEDMEDKGNISDGYHTFNELYEYRLLYNASMFNELAKQGLYDVHKSKRHSDGTIPFGDENWFIVQAELPTGQISNHYEMKDWVLFNVPEKEKANTYDGHTPQDVAKRLRDFLSLEKLIEPKFKVGDRVKHKNGTEQGVILSITNDTYDVAVTNDMGIFIPISEQDDWELVSDKFDITTLVPFESRVLVRNVDGDLWKPAIYGFPHSKGCYVVGGVYWGQCIPYEENKELLGTTNNLEEYGSR